MHSVDEERRAVLERMSDTRVRLKGRFCLVTSVTLLGCQVRYVGAHFGMWSRDS
jgi:hypothetical protein